MDATIVDFQAAAPRTPRLGWLALSLLAMMALADACLWTLSPRLSVGVFAIGAAGVILLNRPGLRWNRRHTLLVALICGAAAESAIDLCFSNCLVLAALIIALAGETHYEPLRAGWSRWSEALWTLAKTPGRWFSLTMAVAEEARENGPRPAGMVKKTARILWIVGPGLAVTLVFAVILGNGNALFAKFANDLASGVINWINALDINFWRCFFWAFVAWFSLPLLWPSPPPQRDRIWTRELPLLPEISPRMARLQSAVTLGMLNALFCCVNTIDAVYLWAHQALPSGVNHSEFVHHGVASLIIAVLFSAALLAGMFQQPRSVSAWTPLRALGLLWITQNLILLAGVFLRVKLYVEAFDLTVIRVNLVFFLVLVGIGFILLAIHVWGKRSLGWLLNANMLATFFLFYTVQFLDTAGFVARYNVNLWLASHGTHTLDVSYLESLGPPAYEPMQTLAQSQSGGVAYQVQDYLRSARNQAQEQLANTPWQSWQILNRQCQRRLLATPAP